MAGNRRLMTELKSITGQPPEGCHIRLPKEDDLLLWEVTLDGPSNSVYTGGKFTLHITLPADYPFKPPVLNFKTKIYHPNVSNDERGYICLGMLKADEWKPPNKIADVLRLVRTVMAEPQPDDAVEGGIAEQYKNDRKAWEKVARDWTGKYAK